MVTWYKWRSPRDFGCLLLPLIFFFTLIKIKIKKVVDLNSRAYFTKMCMRGEAELKLVTKKLQPMLLAITNTLMGAKLPKRDAIYTYIIIIQL